MKSDIPFLLKIGTALQVLGMDAQRLESALGFLAVKLNIKADFFSMPTSLMVAISHGEQQEHFFKRTEPGEIHLEKLTLINAIGNQVCEGKLSTAAALKEIEDLDTMPERYSLRVANLFFGFAASCICIFIGGNWHSAVAAFLLGLLVGVFTLNKNKFHMAQIADAIAVFVVSFLAYLLAAVFPNVDPAKIILASVLMIIPGVTMTIAVTELAAQHLVAGTSRLMLAIMTFFKIAFGVALALKIFSLFSFPIGVTDFAGYPSLIHYLGLFCASLTLSVLFRAEPRDTLWISVSCLSGYASSHFGQNLLGPYLGLMLGGCTVAVGSNLFSKVFNRPILITLLPGILVLVPGAIGFQSLNMMYQNNLLLGIDAAFKTIAMVVSLVAGIFIGNLILRTEQHF